MFLSIAGIVLYVQKFGRYMPGPFARPDIAEHEARRAKRA